MSNLTQVTTNSTSQAPTLTWQQRFNSRPAAWLYLLLLAVPVIILSGRGLSQNFIADDWYILWDQAKHGYNGQLFELGWGYVRPIGVLTWKIGYHLFGLNPAPFYLIALLLQLANTWLCYSIVTRWLNSRLAGFTAGLLFCTYAWAWEPTLWLSSAFFDVQSAFFMLLGFRLFLDFRPQKQSPTPNPLLAASSALRLTAIVGCYFLATFSKESGLLLLPICLFYDFSYKRLAERGWRLTLIFYALLLLVTASFFVAHYWPGTKVTTGDVIHLNQLPQNFLYQIEGLYLLPIYPYAKSFTALIFSQLKFGLWLLPAWLIFAYLAFKVRKTIRVSPALQPFLHLFIFGLAWSLFGSVATLALDYRTLRFLYVAHIGATFSTTATIFMLAKVLIRPELTRIARTVAYAGLVYIVGFLSVAGLLGFIQGSQIYAKSSDFTRQFVGLAHQQILNGATDLTLLNLPNTIDLEETDQPLIFFDDLNPQLVLLLKLGFPRDYVQVLRTADLPQLGYDAVGLKIAPAQIPAASPTQPIITVTRLGPGNYQLVVQR